MPAIPVAPLGASPGAAADIAAASPQAIAASVPALMNEWHVAIVNKDAETVERLDRSFAAYSGAFIPALMESAKSDPEPRVRSFSTRVLGKLRPPESADLMRELLGDPSEFVRFNAAWALGELGDHDARGRLRHLEQRDPSPLVRRSAGESLRKLDGG